MQWSDQGIILGTKRHGESAVIAEIMTCAHGRHMGLVRSGRSRVMQPVLQPGNQVEVTWRARLEEHLGEYRIEPLQLRAAQLMESAVSVYGVQALSSLLRLLPERDPHRHLYDALNVILDHFSDPRDACELYIRFELAMLDDLGFGLDLTKCAATGTQDALIYVSPKTGRAVCAEAGAPYAQKLLPLPSFLDHASAKAANAETITEAFALTGYFLERHVYEPRGVKMSETRAALQEAVLKALKKQVENV